MSQELIDLIEKRKNEAIAIILRFKENECDTYLPENTKARLRKVILDQINDLANLSSTLMKSVNNDSVHLNSIYLDKISHIYDSVVTSDGKL